MKLLVLFAISLQLVTADSSTTQDVKEKPIQKNVNSLPVSHKPEYQQVQYVAQPYQPQHQHYVQLVQKPLYVPQQAMIIIAQPAYVPANVLYGSNAVQQLVHYFHNNPQARYQLLQGAYQAPQQTHYVQPATVASSSIGNYQLIAAPASLAATPQYHHPNLIQTAYYNPAAAASPVHQQQSQTHQQQSSITQPQTHYQTVQQPVQTAAHYTSPTTASIHHSQAQPLQLSQISRLTHLTAQHYFNAPTIKSAPPIITGFENFTPEQQAKIKAQLSAHFGAQLQPIKLSPGAESQGKVYTAFGSSAEEGAGQSQQQYSAKYHQQQPQQQAQQQEEYVPSTQIKNNDIERPQAQNQLYSAKV